MAHSSKNKDPLLFMPFLAVSLLLLSCTLVMPYLSDLDIFWDAVLNRNWAIAFRHPFLVLTLINLVVGILSLMYVEAVLFMTKVITLINAGYFLLIFAVWHDYIFVILSLLATGSLLISAELMEKNSNRAGLSALGCTLLTASLASLSLICHAS